MIFEAQIDTAIEGLFKQVAADYNLSPPGMLTLRTPSPLMPSRNG